jgi:hypothetical protein
MFAPRSFVKIACPILVALTTALSPAIPAAGTLGPATLSASIIRDGGAIQLPPLKETSVTRNPGTIIRDDFWLAGDTTAHRQDRREAAI